jgi:ribosomal protein S11
MMSFHYRLQRATLEYDGNPWKISDSFSEMQKVNQKDVRVDKTYGNSRIEICCEEDELLSWESNGIASFFKKNLKSFFLFELMHHHLIECQ